MTAVDTPLKRRTQSIHAVVTRADGSREDRGMVSYWHWFPPLRWVVNPFLKIKWLFNKHVRGWQ